MALTADDYRRAILVQDASNLSGVVHSFSKVISKIWEEACDKGEGTEWVNRHPIAVLYASKISSLTDCEPVRNFSHAYQLCQDQAGL